MAKTGRRQALEDLEQDPTPSLGTMFPHVRLVAAIVLQATRDLEKADPIRALDSLLWLLDDGSIMLEILGLEVSDNRLLEICGGPNGKKFRKKSSVV